MEEGMSGSTAVFVNNLVTQCNSHRAQMRAKSLGGGGCLLPDFPMVFPYHFQKFKNSVTAISWFKKETKTILRCFEVHM